MTRPTLAAPDRELIDECCRKLACYVVDLLLDDYKKRTIERARVACEAALRDVLTEALRVDGKGVHP